MIGNQQKIIDLIQFFKAGRNDVDSADPEDKAAQAVNNAAPKCFFTAVHVLPVVISVLIIKIVVFVIIIFILIVRRNIIFSSDETFKRSEPQHTH